MVEENISQEFKKYRWNKKLFLWRKRTKRTDEDKAQKGWSGTTLDYIERFLILASAITECV